MVDVGLVGASVHAALARSTAEAFAAAAIVDDVGAVVDINGSVAMQANSTVKLWTGAAALAVLGDNRRLRTEVRRTGEIDSQGVVEGDLVLVGGADPSFTLGDLDGLADEVYRVGIRTVRGAVVGDVSRHEYEAPPTGWADYYIPNSCGPLSPLSVAANSWRRDESFLAEPTQINVGRFGDALSIRGVQVEGPIVVSEVSVPGITVTTRESAPMSELVRSMLKSSDTFAAEMLLREIGASAGKASTAGGLAALAKWQASLGNPRLSVVYDGSGLSPLTEESPWDQVRLLVRLDDLPIGASLRDAVPVAGVDGTLQDRFRDTAAAGRVRAKTGSRRRCGSVNLAGYATGLSGRVAWFSFMLTGATAFNEARRAMDDAVLALVASI